MDSRHRLVLLALALLSVRAAAGNAVWDSVQVHGFAAQAMLYSDDNRWFARRTGTSFDFTEIGLNASVRPVASLLLAGQVLARRAGEMSDGTPALDFALADLSLVANAHERIGLRLGRLKNPLGLYNATRDVPFTHPGIFLPQVVYYDKVRNLVLSTDGAMLYAESRTPLGTLSLNLLGGRAVIDENVEWAYLGRDYPGDLKPDGNSTIAGLWYTSPSERLRVGLSGALLAMRFTPARREPSLGAGGIDLQYGIASVQYSAEDWSLTAEYAREPLHWHGFGPYFPDYDAVGEGYYVQGTWRPLGPIELMLCYQEGYANRADPTGFFASLRTGGMLPAFDGYSHILSLGVRWDINAHWMVRAEYAQHRGTFILSTRENPDPGNRDERWEMFGVQAVLRF